MPGYSNAFNQSALSTSNKTAATIAAAAAAASGIAIRRGKIYEIFFSQEGSPSATDCDVQWDVSRVTALGTNTSSAPNPDDPADAAFQGQMGINHTVEPTYAAQGSGLGMLNFALNQRATYRWQVDESRALIYPATASNGFGVRALVGVGSAYTGAGGGAARFIE